MTDKHYPDFKNALDQLALKESVRIFGFLPDEDLLKLMLAADVFTFPSLYEGFGLPILEALSIGLPVIAGNNSSVPEVMGKHGIMLDDRDKQSWVKNILELINSGIDSNSNHNLQESRIAHAKTFTWDKTAQLTLEAYRYFIEKI